MALKIRKISDEKYGLVDRPFRVYEVPEGIGLDEYALEDYRQPISFDGNKVPLTYLQLAKNPATRKFVPFEILYDAEAYTDEDILAIPTLGQVGQTCSYCQARNAGEELISKLPAIQGYQRPVGTPKKLDLGDVITPSVIPTAVDVFAKIFCQPLGEALLKIGVSGLSSIAAGWAAEGGTQEAWRKISEDVVSEYKVCPTDIPAFQQNVLAIKEALDKDKKNIIGALATGTIKNFGQLAKEHGFEVSGAANAHFAGRASVAVAPMQRGGGRAID
jgi:hypothetical protein